MGVRRKAESWKETVGKKVLATDWYRRPKVSGVKRVRDGFGQGYAKETPGGYNNIWSQPDLKPIYQHMLSPRASRCRELQGSLGPTQRQPCFPKFQKS